MGKARSGFDLKELLNQRSKQQGETMQQEEQGTTEGMNVVMLNAYDLIPSEDNFYSVEDIEELKFSIALLGVLQPLLVIPEEKGYKIKAGHRRRMACIALAEEGMDKYKYVPCVIKEEDKSVLISDGITETKEEQKKVDTILERLSLIMANSFRDKSDWEKMEEALQQEALIEELRKTINVTGRTRTILREVTGGKIKEAQMGRYKAIKNNLCPELMEEFKENHINISVANEASGLSADYQRQALEMLRTNSALTLPDVKKLKESEEIGKQIPGQIEWPEPLPQKIGTEPTECEYREGHKCTLTPEQKGTPGDGSQCERSCCWECKYHSMCEQECNSSAGRDGTLPQFDARWFVQHWAKRFPTDLKAVMRICRKMQKNADRAKAVQKYISPYGARCQCCWEYDFSFHGFAGGMDFRIGRVKAHFKYGRFVEELIALINPWSAKFDDELVKEIEEAQETVESIQNESEPEAPERLKSEIPQICEEEQLPDENWNLGDLPQAKEKYIKSLARILVEKRGRLLAVNIVSGFLNDKRIQQNLEGLALETDRAIEMGSDVIACPCADIIEFSCGVEDLGVCSYARFGTQVRKSFEEWRARKDSEAAPVKPADSEPVTVADYEEIKEDRPYTMNMVMTEIMRWKDKRELSKPDGTKPSEVMYKKACMMYDAMLSLHASMGGEFDDIA